MWQTLLWIASYVIAEWHHTIPWDPNYVYNICVLLAHTGQLRFSHRNFSTPTAKFRILWLKARWGELTRHSQICASHFERKTKFLEVFCSLLSVACVGRFSSPPPINIRRHHNMTPADRVVDSICYYRVCWWCYISAPIQYARLLQ